MESEITEYGAVLLGLKRAVETALTILQSPEVMLDSTPCEIAKFKREHPGAHVVIGDFEIKCLDPDKYHLPERLNSRARTHTRTPRISAQCNTSTA